MNYKNIFPLTLEGPAPLYPIISSLFGGLLYAALFEFGYNRIIERLYGETTGWKVLYRVQIYLFLVNLPSIILLLSGLLYNSSLLPFETALKLDEAHMMILCGYICYLQQSRQTPVRGFVVIKDSLLMMVGLGVLSPVYMNGQLTYSEALTVLPIYLVGLFLQAFTNDIEQFLLLALKIKERNIYRASFLLTEKSQPSNFLQLKDIVSTHRDQIDEQLQDFIAIATRLKKSNQEISTLVNFARVFIPIKKAYEIKEQASAKEIRQQFQREWDRGQHDYNQERDHEYEDETEKVYSFNHSASTLMIKRTFTTDSLVDEEDQHPEQIICVRLLKCAFYPLFLSAAITGRLRYFMDYLIILLLSLCMFVIANSIAYFALLCPSNIELTSLIFSALLFYPVARYFLRISEGTNDYDFLGIFMGGVTLKICAFTIGIAFLNILSNDALIEGSSASFVSLMIRVATVFTFIGFLGWKRFAMRFDNLKFFIVLFSASQLLRVLQENLMNGLP